MAQLADFDQEECNYGCYRNDKTRTFLACYKPVAILEYEGSLSMQYHNL